VRDIEAVASAVLNIVGLSPSGAVAAVCSSAIAIRPAAVSHGKQRSSLMEC
jgi:hypothetical protein